MVVDRFVAFLDRLSEELIVGDLDIPSGLMRYYPLRKLAKSLSLRMAREVQ